VIKRGEVYSDSSFIYPEGNQAEKLIIILNKNYTPPEPIIAVPTTTTLSPNNFNLGCNSTNKIYYIKAKQDFFKEDTFIQLYVINTPMSESIFYRKLTTTQEIRLMTSLKYATITSIVKCIETIKEDIDTYLHQFLF